MVDDYDVQEDRAAIVEPVLDVDDSIYWEFDIEYAFKDSN